MRKGSGWAQWERFSAEYLCVMKRLRRKYGYTIGRKTLQHLGYQYLVSAAEHHFGGLGVVNKRLNLPPAQNPPRTRNGQLGTYRTKRYQRRFLRKYFPQYYAAGILPTYMEVKELNQTLAYHWNRVGWVAGARELGMIPKEEGRRQLHRVGAINQALDYFENHGRYPGQRQCRPPLRHIRKRSMPWVTVIAPPHLHPRLARQLLVRLIAHWQWRRERNLPADDIRLAVFRVVLGLPVPCRRPARFSELALTG